MRDDATSFPPPDRRARSELTRAVVGIGLYAGAFGLTFGAVAVGSGLSVAQAMLLSLVMFSGASQFAFVGVVAAGAAPYAAIPTALLLGLRNAFYGVPVTGIVRPRGLRRLLTAHLVIDETTAMAVAQADPRLRRLAFWSTGVVLFCCWNGGTLLGGLVGRTLDATALGLDAAAPAAFLALLWPQLTRRRAVPVALLAALVAVTLIPVTPVGVPVIAAAAVALVAGLLPARTPPARRPAARPAVPG